MENGVFHQPARPRWTAENDGEHAAVRRLLVVCLLLTACGERAPLLAPQAGDQWPSHRRDLVLSWERGEAPVEWRGPDSLPRRGTWRLTAGARLAGDGWLDLAGGTAEPDGDTLGIAKAIAADHAFTLCLTIAAPIAPAAAVPILTIGGPVGAELSLMQERQHLRLRLRTTADRGRGSDDAVGWLEAGATHRIVIGWSGFAQRMVVFVDGRRVRDDRGPGGDLAVWQTAHPLRLGGGGWQGRVQHLAVFSRLIDDDQAWRDAAIVRQRLEPAR